MTQLIVTDHGGGKIEYSHGWRLRPLPRPVAPASERRIRECNWCGGRYRKDHLEPARYCSQECSIDSRNLSE